MGKIKGIVNDEGRTCTVCGEFKMWDEFYNYKRGARGKESRCKICEKQCKKQYREENRDVLAEKAKQYYEENRDIKLEKNKQYYEENRDEILEKQRRYYEENRDIKLKKQKQYREENRDVIAERHRQYYEDNYEAKKEYRKEYYEENRGVVLEKQKQWDNSPANSETYKDQLTTLESPRETEEGYLKVKCATCGEYYIPTNIQVKSRVQSLKGNRSGENRLYCSDSCKEACSVYKQHTYPKGFKKPSNREYATEFRNMILERDNYTCQVCGLKFDNKLLQAHHITPVVCSPMEQVDIDNGICVCKECHINLHLTQEGITYAELSRAGKENEQ